MSEIQRFLQDASDAQPDGELLHLDAQKVFDADTLRWYRRAFEDRNPGLRRMRSNMEFLHEWGFVKEREDGRLAPTRAAVLVLGRGRYVRHVLVRPVVDCQMVNTTFHQWDPDLLWDDRIVVEENLVQAWLALSEGFLRRAERPFRIDPATMLRIDEPPDYAPSARQRSTSCSIRTMASSLATPPSACSVTEWSSGIPATDFLPGTNC